LATEKRQTMLAPNCSLGARSTELNLPALRTRYSVRTLGQTRLAALTPRAYFFATCVVNSPSLTRASAATA